MTKKELTEQILAICEANKVPKEATEALLELVKSKRTGSRINLDEITRKNDKGEITHILDQVFQIWLPVKFFKPKEDALGYEKIAILSKKARAEAEKTYKASKEAIVSDLLEGKITQDKAKALLEKAEKQRVPQLPEDFKEFVKKG